MARILVGTYMIRYPLGGMVSWGLQWLVGLHRLGHEVYLVEKSGYPNSCFDPSRNVMSDDCSYGTSAIHELLCRFGLGDRWAYVDSSGRCFGLAPERLRDILDSADLLLDLGTHGAWLEDAEGVPVRVLVDGEPGYTQMKMEKRMAVGEQLPVFDHYYSNGANIGTPSSPSPTAGREWRPVFNPVVTDLFRGTAAAHDSCFTTVMNWQAHDPFVFEGATFHQKDLEFARFMDLPALTAAPLEVAVAGRCPRGEMETIGWRIRDAHDVSISFDSFQEYIHRSAGEFSVCKHGYVALNTGWFSDRSAAYLAAGRPVVMQETGFSEHLPCGTGLFAVRSVDEAASALESIRSNWEQHSRAAREIAREFLDTDRVLPRFLGEIGVN